MDVTNIKHWFILSYVKYWIPVLCYYLKK